LNSSSIITSVNLHVSPTDGADLARIPIRRISREQGMPSGQVHDLVQDMQGIFWFATPSGLASYDGSAVHTYSKKDGLSTQGLRTLAQTSDGRIWVGSDAGVDIVEPDGRIHPLADEWTHGLVEKMAVDANQNVWLGTAHGLLQCPAGGNALLRADDFRLASAWVNSLVFDSAGRLWATGPQFGLLYRENGRWLAPHNWDWTVTGAINKIVAGPDGTLFVGGERGIAQIRPDGRAIRHYTTGNAFQAVSAMLWADNLLWACVGGAFVRLAMAGNQWQLKDTVLPNALINALSQDNHGNIWVASDTHGVFKISVLRHAISRPKLPDIGAVFALRETSPGKFLLGGERGAARFDLAQPAAVQALKGMEKFKVWDLLETAAGQVWAATQQGLYTFIGTDEPRRIGTDHSVLSAPARVLHERGNSVWIGTLRGLTRIVAGDAIEVLSDKGEPLGYVYTLFEDRKGVLWVGTLGNGLWKETPSGFTSVVGDGFDSRANVYAIAQHVDGRMVFLHDASILLKDADGHTTLFAESADPLAGWSAKFGPDNKLYVGSAGGLRIYDLDTRAMVREITSWMGLSGWEFTTSRSLSLVAPGLMLCGLNSGLAVVDLREIAKFSTLPTVRLRSASWSQAKYVQKDSHVTVDYGKWSVDLALNTGWFLDEEDVRIHVRLLGFDSKWTAPEHLSHITYNSLPIGNYIFEAQAHSPLVGWGPAQRLLTIHVRAPWRQFGWANLISLLGIERLTLASSRKRNRKLLEKNIELEQTIRERTLDMENANQELQRLNKELEKVSRTDALTGVANRRAFDDFLGKEFRRAKRTGLPLSLILLDVDSFKAYNDRYGHQLGDTTLKKVAQAFADTLREAGDLVARYGGEEFAAILPETDVAGAEVVAEKLRKAVEDLHITHDKAAVGKIITVSAGVGSMIFKEDTSISELVTLADRSLYLAKHQGRNRWVRAES
jgi:diguanylate cyclase (GGDEF)-like protein